MSESEMLARIQQAYKVYKENVRPSLDVENFIEWMYKEYGYIPPGLKPSRND